MSILTPMSACQKSQHPPRHLEKLLFVCLLVGAVVGLEFFGGFFSAMLSTTSPCSTLIKSEQAAGAQPTITTTDNGTRIASSHVSAPTQIYAYDSAHHPTPTSPAPLIIAGFLLTATTNPRRKTPPTTSPLHLRQRQTNTSATNTVYPYDDPRSPPHAKRGLPEKNRIPYWPSRDPIAERGGFNLYGFVSNDPVSWIDILGKRINRGGPIRTNYDTMANIIRKYGVFAYTGDPDGGANVSPEITGDIEYEHKKQGEKCCAKVKKAPYLDIQVSVNLPSNWGMPVKFMNSYSMMTASGYQATIGHEFRRRSVYRDANKAFLKPAEGAGNVITKCGWVCRDSYSDAESELQDYVDAIQAEATTQYDEWTTTQQNGIGGEGGVDDWQTVEKTFKINGETVTMDVYVFTGFSGNLHTWENPTAEWEEQCPY